MTREDIIRMARETKLFDLVDVDCKEVRDFVALVASEIMPKEALAEMFEWGKDAGRREEREACAKYLEGYATRFNDIRGAALEVAAENLRARGQND